MRGAVIVIPVGGGKTLIATLAGTVLGAANTIIFTRAPLVEDMWREWRTNTTVNFRTTGDITVVSHDLLGRPEQANFLREQYARFGDRLAIVCDEVDALKDVSTRRTGRLGRFLRDCPNVPFVAMTGTLQHKSVKDYAHLCDWALRENSPVVSPASQVELDALFACTSVKGIPDYKAWLHGKRLSDWAFTPTPMDVWDDYNNETKRHLVSGALAERIRTARGVVVSEHQTENDYKGEIRIRLAECDVPPEIDAALDELALDGLKPNGDVCVGAAELWFAAVCLSHGFFYYWVWPNNTPDDAWLDARRVWAKWVRTYLKRNPIDGSDSEYLLRTQIAQQPWHPGYKALQPWLVQSQKRWNGKPTPPTREVWLSDWYARKVVEHVRHAPPTIVFYATGAMGRKLHKLGLDVYGVGSDIQHIPARTLAASRKVHGVGKRLHHFSRAFVCEPSKSAAGNEQLIGRMARPRQESPFVEVTYPVHTEVLSDGWDDCVKQTALNQYLNNYPLAITRAKVSHVRL